MERSAGSSAGPPHTHTRVLRRTPPRRCCVWCLENILQFINRNAYIIVGVKGTGYCASAARAMSLIVSVRTPHLTPFLWRSVMWATAQHHTPPLQSCARRAVFGHRQARPRRRRGAARFPWLFC